MDPKLLEILKKAKAIDQKAKQYDSVDKTVLESNVNARKLNNNTTNIPEGMGDYIPTTQQPTTRQMPKVDVNSETYKQRVKSSKLPPEIQRVMLENPIPQPDSPGTFSMSEELIREINPNYGGEQINEVNYGISETVENSSQMLNKVPTQQSFDARTVRKMIAEEIAKALPSIVEKYFDKKMIQENVKALNALNRKKRPQ